MKFLKSYLLFGVFAVGMISCGTPPRPPRPPHPRGAKPMPPGQAKKIFGTKSARPFAPGQRR